MHEIFVRHFVYKLLFHLHLARFGNILIWIDCRKHRSKSFPYLAFRSIYGQAPITRVFVRRHGRQETIFEYEIDREGRNRYCNTYFVSPLFINCREYEVVTTYAKRKLKYSQNEILLHYGEWDRIVTLTGEQAD